MENLRSILETKDEGKDAEIISLKQNIANLENLNKNFENDRSLKEIELEKLTSNLSELEEEKNNLKLSIAKLKTDHDEYNAVLVEKHASLTNQLVESRAL